MKNSFVVKLKKIVVVTVMACMLLTGVGVSSDTGIMVCGEWCESSLGLK